MAFSMLIGCSFHKNDILFVSRLAYDDGLGGAHNNHDANFHNGKEVQKNTYSNRAINLSYGFPLFLFSFRESGCYMLVPYHFSVFVKMRFYYKNAFVPFIPAGFVLSMGRDR